MTTTHVDLIDAINNDPTLCKHVVCAPDFNQDRTRVSIFFDSMTSAARALRLAHTCGWAGRAKLQPSYTRVC